MTEVIGIDHIYIAVTDIELSESFYDRVFLNLGFKKNSFSINGDSHVQYYNRHFGYVLRPAKSLRAHDSYAPGLHHLCLRVNTADDVAHAASALKNAGVEVTDPKAFPEYAHDYVAIFFQDPDGMRLEITNYREERRKRHDGWDKA